MPCPMRSAPRWSSASRTVCGPVDSPACGTLCSPAALAPREVRRELRPRHTDLRAAEPEADQAVRTYAQGQVEGEVRRRDAGLAGDVEAPGAAGSRSRRALARRASSTASQNASAAIPRMTDEYGVSVSSA